jgi:hypothetical protein
MNVLYCSRGSHHLLGHRLVVNFIVCFDVSFRVCFRYIPHTIMEKITRDRESVAALESLLRIRSSGQQESEDIRNKRARVESPLHYSLQESSPATMQSQSLFGIFLPQRSYAHQVQIAAARAAIAAACPRLESPHHHSRVPNPLQSFVTNKKEAKTSSGDLPSDDPAVAEEIRKHKVEAALRSKPQRGRKRDDLSAKERQELTRSRNREHAKTTR